MSGQSSPPIDSVVVSEQALEAASVQFFLLFFVLSMPLPPSSLHLCVTTLILRVPAKVFVRSARDEERLGALRGRTHARELGFDIARQEPAHVRLDVGGRDHHSRRAPRHRDVVDRKFFPASREP